MNEAIIIILDQFRKDGIQVNEKKAALAIEIAMSEYNITPKSTAVAVLSDLPRQANNFLACKHLKGLQPGTLKNYKRTLRDLHNHTKKMANDITITDLRVFIYERSETLKNSTKGTLVWCIKSFFG